MQVICEKAGECHEKDCMHRKEHNPEFLCSMKPWRCAGPKCIPVTEEGEKP